VADEERAIGKFFPLPQPLRADEDGAHTGDERGDDIALKIVANEQHPIGRCFGSGEDKLVEERAGLADAERVGEQRDAEQVVDPGFLEGRPAGLVRLGVAGGQNDALAMVVVQGAQRGGGFRVDWLLADQVVDRPG